MSTSIDTPKSNSQKPSLSLFAKLIYGSGDWGRASFNTIRQFFYAIFLTDVVGIEPRLASIAALVSIIWDAINDPIVGTISDNVRTRWGRRRPFLLIFAIPFSLAFILMWWAPPWESQIMLTVHVTLAYMVSDTIQTLITVPYLSLTPELSGDYDERTSLTSVRMFFNLIASLVTAVAAPMIMDASVDGGLSIQQAYLTIAALFGGMAALPFFFIFFKFKEEEIPPEESPITAPSFKETLKGFWKNIPFRYATGIYVLNWIAVDIEGLMLPYFLLYIISKGDLLSKANLFGAEIALESVVIGFMLITATLAIPLWNWFAQKSSKRFAYIVGMVFWTVVQMLVFSLQPGQTTLIILLASLAGLSVSTAHVIPEAIFPDVIDWDEFISHSRREGMYYGAIHFIRKLSSAIATFLVLQALGWFGYQTPPDNAIQFMQPDSVIMAIRFLTGPLIAVLLISAILFAWRYPLTRERQQKVQRSLERRQQRRANRKAKKVAAGQK